MFYSLLVVGPLILTFYYSLYSWDGLSPYMNFNGLGNYRDALHDSAFKQTIYVTFFYTIVSGLIANALGLFFAILLNNKGKLTNFYRSVFFFPVLLSAVVIGFIWQTLLGYVGIVNQFLSKIGIEPVEFFGTPTNAMWSITGIMVWSGVGFTIVFYLAGLQTVSPEYYDAAKIDGASAWRRFRHVTFPMIAPAVTLNVVFAIIGGLKQFDLIKVTTGGGPAKSTETMTYAIIREAFENSHYSYGASMAIYLLLIITVITVFTTAILRRREEHVVD